MLMANSHVAHNCRLHNNVILVNGVLLGGHVHVQDGAIISGNTVVHHFTTVGTLAFVSGGCRVPHDIPPYMLAAGSDNPTLKTINIVGMRRAGISEPTIRVIKRAHRLLFREHKKGDAVRELLLDELNGVLPIELTTLLKFLEQQAGGKLGRAREAFRDSAGHAATGPAEAGHDEPGPAEAGHYEPERDCERRAA
jgi:UDP-N-acetylglucosamine acyltransferase